MKQRTTSSFCGFTLVELLVVIAVLSILLAILTPVIHRSIYQARHATCISRKGQLLVALNSYVADHDGYYPLRWPNGRTGYWHPYWWGTTRNPAKDMHEEIEAYFGSSGSTPTLLLCAVTPDSMWGVPASGQWPLGTLYRTSVAVYAGWDWRHASANACVPQVPLDALPMRASEAINSRPLVGDVIESTTGVHPVYTGWMTNHAYSRAYHRRSSAGPTEIPKDPIPFGYPDGSVIATRELEGLYLDRGWALRYWAAPSAHGTP